MAWKYIAAAVGMFAAAGVGVFYVLGESSVPAFFSTGAVHGLGTRPAKIKPADLAGYEVMQSSVLLETGTEVRLAKRREGLTRSDTVFLIKCLKDDCTRQKLLQEKSIPVGIAGPRFDQFVFLTGDGSEVQYVNVADNAVSRGTVQNHCTRFGEAGAGGQLKSVAARSLYMTFKGEDCKSLSWNGKDYPLTDAELKEITTDLVKFSFEPSGKLAAVELESGADFQGHKLK